MPRRKAHVSTAVSDLQNISLENLAEQVDKLCLQYDELIAQIANASKEDARILKLKLDAIEKKRTFLQRVIDQFHGPAIQAMAKGRIKIEIVCYDGTSTSMELDDNA